MDDIENAYLCHSAQEPAHHCGLFPVADRPGCRRIGPCLHIKWHYQESPCAGVLHEWLAFPIAGAGAHVPLSARLRSVRTRNSADAHRTSTAERRTGRASQASPVLPASDVCFARNALPPVSLQRCPASRCHGSFNVTLCPASHKKQVFLPLFQVNLCPDSHQHQVSALARICVVQLKIVQLSRIPLWSLYTE